MHVQNSVFKSVIGTFLDIKSKTKEGLNSRFGMQHLKIKKELHPILLENGKYQLPAASYNLNREEKHATCVWLKNLKVASGFCSNIRGWPTSATLSKHSASTISRGRNISIATIANACSSIPIHLRATTILPNT